MGRISRMSVLRTGLALPSRLFMAHAVGARLGSASVGATSVELQYMGAAPFFHPTWTAALILMSCNSLMDGKYQVALLFGADANCAAVKGIVAKLVALDTSDKQPCKTRAESTFPVFSTPDVVPIKLENLHQFDANGRRLLGAASR